MSNKRFGVAGADSSDGPPLASRCTCLEVHGEDPDCPRHGVLSVVSRLRELKHDVAHEAADLLESLWDRSVRAS